MSIDQLNTVMNTVTWFLYAREIRGQVVIFVTESAPTWEKIKQIKWIQEANVTGIYMLN